MVGDGGTMGWKQPGIASSPPPNLLTKDFITGCCCNIIYEEKAIAYCFHRFVPPSPTICLKIQFLAFYPHLCLVKIALFTPPLLLTKMLSLDAVVIIYTMRKLFQTVSTLLSRHFPLFVSKLNFWPFFPNLCLLMVNHLIPALLLLKEILSLDAVKIICMKRKLFHVVSTPFSWHYPSLA